jgi:hypothetical protein
METKINFTKLCGSQDQRRNKKKSALYRHDKDDVKIKIIFFLQLLLCRVILYSLKEEEKIVCKIKDYIKV